MSSNSASINNMNNGVFNDSCPEYIELENKRDLLELKLDFKEYQDDIIMEMCEDLREIRKLMEDEEISDDEHSRLWYQKWDMNDRYKLYIKSCIKPCMSVLYKELIETKEKMEIIRKIWDNNIDKYSLQHEGFYDEKFKENTKRTKGKFTKLKFSEKVDKRMCKSWVKQDVGVELFVSKKTLKSELIPDYKQNKIKNFRKSSRCHLRQQTCKM